jgi:protease I
VFLVANEGVEQVELTSPWQAVQEAGGQPVLATPNTGEVQAFNHLDKGDVFQATVAAADLRPDDYDGVVLPGGVANPDQLRTDEAAVGFVGQWTQSGRPLAAARP